MADIAGRSEGDMLLAAAAEVWFVYPAQVCFYRFICNAHGRRN